MGKNILVLTGSPRKNGNSEMMADAFIEGAKSVGHNVTKFEAAMKNVNGCIACDTCWSKGTACSISDDFHELEPLLENSDVIVFATPIYWAGLPSQLKAVMDRFYAYLSSKCIRPLNIKESVFIICGESKDPKVFDATIEAYKVNADYLKWEQKGIIAISDVFAKNDILKTDALEQAKKLGMGI